MFVDLIFVILGIVLLIKSADFLVDSSSDLAGKLGVSAVVVGAIVVGFGTSMPEMAVSTTAAVKGDISLGIGNVVGSIIANLTLVLGATAFTAAIPLPKHFLKFHMPLSINATVWFFVFIQNGLRRYEGIILLGLLIISLSLMIREGKRDVGRNIDLDTGQKPIKSPASVETKSRISNSVVILLSLIGVVGSSYFITEGSIGLAEKWGIESGFVGASLIAVGTSLPELVASVVALRKGKSEMIIGTILGSNVFNGVAIGAAMGILGPGGTNGTRISGWISIISVTAALALWIWKSLSAKPIKKLSGALLLGIYALWLVLVGL
ncbi:MAG: hypothetical protein CL431_04460 [Acidimicrobiaceae bacterium]|jgi:cation:H+ antiporter|nr:hypothetical protein [Acidimicrobiaceae bacterium]|tara:strand:+ start:7032 stop:7997 length:966 start_codon:yes stop_codon:yes gene_type:complete